MFCFTFCWERIFFQHPFTRKYTTNWWTMMMTTTARNFVFIFYSTAITLWASERKKTKSNAHTQRRAQRIQTSIQLRDTTFGLCVCYATTTTTTTTLLLQTINISNRWFSIPQYRYDGEREKTCVYRWLTRVHTQPQHSDSHKSHLTSGKWQTSMGINIHTKIHKH